MNMGAVVRKVCGVCLSTAALEFIQKGALILWG